MCVKHVHKLSHTHTGVRIYCKQLSYCTQKTAVTVPFDPPVASPYARRFPGCNPGWLLVMMPVGNGKRLNVTIHNTSVDNLFPTFEIGSAGWFGSWQRCVGAAPVIMLQNYTD